MRPFNFNQEVQDSDAKMIEIIERDKLHRWNAINYARVTHPAHGTVIVPHSSKLSAIMCAAELWECTWISVIHAQVWAAEMSTNERKANYDYQRKRIGQSD